MDDIPWHLVAIVFITFAIWIRDRIQEAAEWRRRRKAERKAREFARRTGSPPPQPPSPYLAEYPEYEEEYIEEDEFEQPKTFRELFEEVQQHIEPDVEPEPQEVHEAPAKQPPPLPGEIATIDYDEIDPSVPAEPMQVRRPSRQSDRKATDPLSRILKDRERLRTAVLLQEILDKPKALREDGSF